MIDPTDPGPVFRITPEARGAALAWARGALPFEACGLLAGRGRVASVFLAGENEERSPSAYRVAAGSMIAALRAIRDLGLEWLGVFHSHPASEARPSATDVALAFYPEPAYLIASFRDRAAPELRAFRIRGGRAREIPVRGTGSEGRGPGPKVRGGRR